VGFFLIATALAADSLLEIVGVAAGMLIFYAPATLWSGGMWSVAAILVLGLLAAALTHRYRVTGAGPAWRRAGPVVFVLLLVYTSWTLRSGRFSWLRRFEGAGDSYPGGLQADWSGTQIVPRGQYWRRRHISSAWTAWNGFTETSKVAHQLHLSSFVGHDCAVSAGVDIPWS
jgi:hypothetical protein